MEAGVITADYSKISFNTKYIRPTMIEGGRNRKFKRGYAVCQLVDSRNELQLLQQDEKSIYSSDKLFRGSVCFVSASQNALRRYTEFARS